MTLEVCIESAAGLQSCIEGSADRIEVCTALDLGGLTPSTGLIQHVSNFAIPAYVMIRPRAGNFIFTDHEIEIMCNDISFAKSAGLAGVVLGASNLHGQLDYHTLQRLCTAAGDIKKTLHRVIDTLKNPLEALEQAIDLGMNHILTSGGAPSVHEGIGLLRKMNQVAAGRIDIMAGAGLTPEIALHIYKETGITSFHSSCRQPVATDPALTALGFSSSQCYATCSDVVRQYKNRLTDLDH